MTKPEELATGEEGPSTLRRVVLVILAVLLLAFTAGVIAGMGAAILENGLKSPLKIGAVALLCLAVIAVTAAFLLRQIRSLFAGPVSPRTRRARMWMIVFMATGLVTGILLQWGNDPLRPVELGELAVSPTAAITAMAIWIAVIPFGTWLWWRQIDEHEALAYKDGAFIALNAYSTLFPAWWIGWRGGLFTEPDQMLIFGLTLTIWGLVWLVRRYG